MDLSLRDEFVRLWGRFFPGEPLPITFELSPDLRNTPQAKASEDWRCFVCDLAKIRNGKNLAFDATSITCKGGLRYCGYVEEKPPDFRYFLSHGIEGKVEGERYKKTPDLVDTWQDEIQIIPSTDKYLLFKRWDNLDETDDPAVVIFFARPEVISGLFSLANYNRADPYGVITPMGAGCSSIVHYPWHEQQSPDPRAVLGMMDPSARICVPLDVLTFAVPMKKFVSMIHDMEESFLITKAWDRVIKKIERDNRLYT
ncbi:MAG: DUF169 domain-containing protein [Methanospirillum sp.]|uniref:DUF169 domain-containing protein n=1 Tax=Methanospirillum sp. TaxID=45200 RepID=UPI0023732125|nr:DUF169 domain-containing protein [Methanospirillum sp.]MDD1729514.1 DUF169 domain-containing protein [Methanospirillum sp.]